MLPLLGKRLFVVSKPCISASSSGSYAKDVELEPLYENKASLYPESYVDSEEAVKVEGTPRVGVSEGHREKRPTAGSRKL